MQIAVGLRRMFSALAGMPLSEYVRRGRMTVAAPEVVTGIGDLLGIAVRYGYGSAEAFGRPGVPVRTRRQPGPTHGKAHLLDDHPARRLCRGGGGRPRHRAEDQAAADHRRSAPRPSNGEPGSPPPVPASATVAEAGWRALSRSGIRLRPGLAAGCSAGVGRHPTTLDVRIRGCHDCRRATGRLPAHRFGAPRREAGGQRHRWVGVSSPAVGRAAGATWGR
jgi:AraC-like DNA-binding protein